MQTHSSIHESHNISRPRAVIVGDKLELSVPFAVKRKPRMSAATESLDVFDVPGVYDLAFPDGREVRFVAWPASVLGQKIQPTHPHSSNVTMHHLTGAVLDPRATFESLTAALEATKVEDGVEACAPSLAIFGGDCAPNWNLH